MTKRRFNKGDAVMVEMTVDFDEPARQENAKITRKFKNCWDVITDSGERLRIEDDLIHPIIDYTVNAKKFLDPKNGPKTTNHQLCLCGCGQEIVSRLKRVRFCQGHDGRLCGLLMRAKAGDKNSISRLQTVDMNALNDYINGNTTRQLYWAAAIE